MRHAVGHLTANGVIVLKCGRGGDVLTDVFDNPAELFQGFCRLAIEVNVAIEIEVHHILWFLYDDGSAFSLPHQSQHFGMSGLAEDDDLSAMCGIVVIFPFNALLKVQHHWTGGINDFDVILLGTVVGFRRFTMSAKEYGGVS